MKKKLLPLAAVFCSASMLMGGKASASVLIYEPFDYTSGSLIVPGSTSINSGNGLVDTYGPNAPTTWVQAGTYTSGTTAHSITSPSLTAPSGFPATTGNAAALIGGAAGRSDFNEMARMALPTQYTAGAVLYYSALIHVSDLAGLTTLNSNANANNDLIIGFNNSAGATAVKPNTWAGELTIRLGSTANTYNLGIRASTTAANTTFWEPTNYTASDTLLVVTRWTEGATAGTGGLSELWINPSSANFGVAEGSVPAADGSTVGTFSATAANDHTDSIIIGAGIAAGSNPNETDIDEIRVGTTWADVTTPTVAPEPASLSLLLMGAAGLFGRRRK